MWDVYAMCGHIPTHQCLTCNKPNHSWISRLHTHKNTTVSVQPFSFSLLFSYSVFSQCTLKLFCLSPENHMVKKLLWFGLQSCWQTECYNQNWLYHKLFPDLLHLWHWHLEDLHAWNLGIYSPTVDLTQTQICTYSVLPICWSSFCQMLTRSPGVGLHNRKSHGHLGGGSIQPGHI